MFTDLPTEMAKSSAASDIPDLLEFLRPPVRKVYGSRLCKVDSELEIHPTLYGRHRRYHPIRLKSQSSTSMILQKTTKIVKTTTLKTCGGPGFTPSIRLTESPDPLNTENNEIVQVTVIPKVKQTNQKDITDADEYRYTKPIIQVTVLPSTIKEKKRKHGLQIQTTTSNQESSVKSNLYVVVSRGKKEKLYEVKASGSTADVKRLRKNKTKYDEIDPQQLNQYKNLIKSLNMEKKKRKKNTEQTPEKRNECKIESLVNSRKRVTQKHKDEFDSVANDASCGINGTARKSRLQIMGKIGVTADDKYILDCSATIDGQPIPTRCDEMGRLFSTLNEKCSDESESDVQELKIETLNCDCQTKAGSFQDFSVQTDKCQSFPIGQKLLKRNGSRSTQVDIIFNQIKRSNKLCQCHESNSKSKIQSMEFTRSPAKETSTCGNPVIVISVYPTDVCRSQNKSVLKNENYSSLIGEVIRTALQKESIKVDNIQITNTNAKEETQDNLIQDSIQDRSRPCECKTKKDRSSASKIPIVKASNEPDKPKSIKNLLRTMSPKRGTAAEPKSPRSKSPNRCTTENKIPSPKGERKEKSPQLKVIKAPKPEVSSKLKKENNEKHNKEIRKSRSPDNNKTSPKNCRCTSAIKDCKKEADKEDKRNVKNIPNETRLTIPARQLSSNCKVNKLMFCKSDTGYSNMSINIDSKHEHYDSNFYKNGSSTDVTVMKCNNNTYRNNSMLRNHCAEAESTCYENYPACEFNSKRSISDTDVASIQATRRKEKSLANVRDSIEIFHQHKERSFMRVSPQNSVTGSPQCANGGSTKHFRGDKCNITDPFERDLEIRQLLGVKKRQFSSLQSRERTGFGIWNEYEIQYCVLPQSLRKTRPKVQKPISQETMDEECFQDSEFKTSLKNIRNTHKSIVITPKQNKAEGDMILRTPISLSIKDYFRVKKTLKGKLPKNITKQQKLKRLKNKSVLHSEIVKDSMKSNRHDQVTQIEESDKALVGSFEELVPVLPEDTSPPHISTVEDIREKTDENLQQALTVFKPSSLEEEYICENVDQDTNNAAALLFGYAFLQSVVATNQEQPLRMASNVGHYNIFRNNIQETVSKQDLEVTKDGEDKSKLDEDKPVSVRMLFKGSKRKRCHTPNLGASALTLCPETGVNSAKLNEQAPSKTKQKKPFLKRLVSCMLRSSKAAPPAADEAKNAVMTSSTCDSYYINTSLAPMEVSSSMYDTTDSFYSGHTVWPTLDRGPKKSFFGSMFGLLR
ncbi:uncharacterized protein LOC105387991 isoform X2 [Plutella xylostella]|uniref:uncharacterized protein LOC105387991 isoform X2 n=1 Tax=Plutella xylostella TaxID=51655 RepID=UPI002032F04D|nr:uncharacterized protein LOC105387991 isoform X2 [Plutella xylostella]